MRRSTTFAGTEFNDSGFISLWRAALGLLLVVELAAAITLLAWPAASPPTPVAPPPQPAAARTVQVIPMGPVAAGLADRIRGDFDGAADAVTRFWGDDWRRDVVIVATGSDEQFATLGGGGTGPGSDIAAVTTSERIVFAPGAAGMSDSSLRIVLTHELFHYAARPATANDAPRWLTEGVADFVGRPATPRRPDRADVAELGSLPTDADLDAVGHARSVAYDRAWWFSRFVADRYGTDVLRELYVAACRPGHPDTDTAIRETLGADVPVVLADWRRWLDG
ncbi:peptidase [Mycolicibacterium arabiense]|uniref:Peptidase n=1 Tax=Mycolicibacterium arabiense TaxID=1286181 RepID=A0A7I7RR65_9MYCO|nr:peptidase [Mycolicibacterium arabiense]MCV7376267.1 peptidase [Mycolicibacterium arabiense]BBY47044.1 peptidase [Mycolicibacterium arabiense]